MTIHRRKVENLWLRNPLWIGGPAREHGLIHGMLLRGDFEIEARLPICETIEKIAPAVSTLMGEIGNSGKSLPFVIYAMDQVHGDRIAVLHLPNHAPIQTGKDAEAPSAKRSFELPQTDGLVTDEKNQLLVVKTADCLPILFFDPETEMIGACHCGWRGLLARLAQKTADEMIAHGAREHSLQAWIGPGISEPHYEVGEELVARFRAEFPAARVSRISDHLDLIAVAIDQLLTAGLQLENIAPSLQCTFANPDRYHSYRRDGNRAGRMITVIGRLK